MKFFRKAPKQPEFFPANIIDLLEFYGQGERYSQEEIEELGIQKQDLNILFRENFFSLVRNQRERFLTALADIALPVGGWVVYGACAWPCDLGLPVERLQEHPASRALLDAAVAFLRAERIDPGNIRGDVWFHWTSSGGIKASVYLSQNRIDRLPTRLYNLMHNQRTQENSDAQEPIREYHTRFTP
ncbi:MAG TPA: hypothetical protein VFV38_21940, partial [Ktedonobacteraceae bacterium]|nr:hypothetical protein [Ktedonobacteraceae bacterium]